MIRDADIEQAGWEARGARLHRMEARGICTHGHVQGWAPPPYGNPAVRPGTILCLGCGVTFDSEAAWHQALADLED